MTVSSQVHPKPDPLFWKGKRVLLTGHTGFKGSWLALWLLELGVDLTGLALAPEPGPNLFDQLELQDRMDHRLGDIRDQDVVKQLVAERQPEVVLHLAAQPLVRRSYNEPLATWETNVNGTLHVLEAVRTLDQPCTAVLITTDKVYRNNEWLFGYREIDPLGGHDPYSSSKAAAEIAIASWRSSFCGSLAHQTPNLRMASARAGNVIGGGDWAADRIVPDAMRALAGGSPIAIRNPAATRPWQHVLEPLGGYLLLAERLSQGETNLATAFNFGPLLEANRTVRDLVEEALRHWAGQWEDHSDPNSPHEASLLHLVIDKAHHELG
ncbi:MAG: CDP-glucose 4,6-dehydratase, partial [Cyanobacteriota bacterium]